MRFRSVVLIALEAVRLNRTRSILTVLGITIGIASVTLTVGLGLDDVRGWPDEVRAVTAAQVRDAARKWLDKTRSVTGYLVKDTTPPKREEKRS